MFKVGEKLEFKKLDPSALIEVLAIWPSGQGQQKQNEYEVVLGGGVMKINQTMMDHFFQKALPPLPFFARPEELPPIQILEMQPVPVEEPPPVEKEVSPEVEVSQAIENKEPKRRGRPPKDRN